MFRKTKIALISALTVLSNINLAHSQQHNDAEIIYTQNHPSFVEDKIDKQKLAWQMAPVKTKSDLKQLLKKPSPLNLLSPEAKKRFIKHLTFSKNGIGSIYASDLELELTPTEIHHVLVLFGAQHLTPTFKNARIESKLDELLMQNNANTKAYDYKGYHCASRGTCKRTTDNYICMRTC